MSHPELRPRSWVGFTLVELLVVIAIVAVLVGIVLAGVGWARQMARRTRSGVQLHSLHQAMSNFAANNNGFYPGRDRNGLGVDSTVGGRFKLLVGEDFVLAKELISPCEPTAKTVFPGGALAIITTNNYSYALPVVTFSLTSGARQDEAKATSNAGAVAICDRAIRNGGDNLVGYQVKSIHTTPAANVTLWQGNVCWNDNHVVFSNSELVQTLYNGVPATNDNLFATPGDFVRTDDLPAGAGDQNDAVMSYYGSLTGLGP